MKKIWIVFAVLLFCGACRKDDIADKQGVSLPPVTNLVLTAKDAGHVTLSWQIPAGIPPEIQQPLGVSVEVTQIVSAMKTISLSTEVLPGAPVTYEYALPDVTATYHFTVKLVGNTKQVDVNYSGTVYSLGATVANK